MSRLLFLRVAEIGFLEFYFPIDVFIIVCMHTRFHEQKYGITIALLILLLMTSLINAYKLHF